MSSEDVTAAVERLEEYASAKRDIITKAQRADLRKNLRIALAALSQQEERVREMGEALADAADRLVLQTDEPWPEGDDTERLHYWRDKAIKVAHDLRQALEPHQ
jgi:hypothetical protein